MYSDISATARLCNALGAMIGERLERTGISPLPPMMNARQLAHLQKSFEDAMGHPVFNAWSGFAQDEKGRRQVRNILTIDPAAVSLAIDPLVKATLNAYIGPDFALLDAGGWETLLPGDEGERKEALVPMSERQTRGIKLVVFVSDVEPGQFYYTAGSHKKARHAGGWSSPPPEKEEQIELFGAAGSIFLFDSAGRLRQTALAEQNAKVIIYNYHVPALAMKDRDADAGSYVPPALNPGFLPELSSEDQRILGIAPCTPSLRPAFDTAATPFAATA